MPRLVAFGTLVVLAFTTLGASQQQPTFRSGSDAVRIFVTVTDRNGRIATHLRQDDFEVRDEGRPQPVTLFDDSPQPIRLIVMLDVSGSMAGNLPLLRASAAQLFPRLSPNDVARVGSFGYEVAISPSFTRDPSELRAALPDAIAQDAPTPLWRAIDKAMDAFRDDRAAETDADRPRPAILVLSDGKDNAPFSVRERPASQAAVIDRARSENVMIYGIGMRSRTRQPMPTPIGPGALGAALAANLPDPGLARVAEETGGGYVEVSYGEDLGDAFAGVIDELHSQYLLAYAPPKRDGKVHDVEVRVSEKGMKPRARKNYVAPKP